MTVSEKKTNERKQASARQGKGGKPGAARRWPGVLAAVLLLAGIALVVALTFMPRDEEDTGERAEREMPVELAEVSGMTLRETVRGVGTLRASASVVLRSEVAGRVRSIEFEEGGAVSEGQLLVEIDDGKMERQLASRRASQRSAEVRLANAQRTFDRQEQLRERGVVSEDEYDRAQSELSGAEAEVEQLQAEVALVEREMEDTRIRAPFDGMISQRLVDRGAYIGVGEDLARLYQVDPLEMTFSMPERYMGRVQRGQPVTIRVTAYPDQSFEGVVDFVSPSIDEGTRDLLVKARIDNPEQALKPGGFATAVVTIGEHADRPVVPEPALVATRRGYSVFVVEDDRAVMRNVRTGLRRDGMVEVVEGVDLGEMVVRAGHLRLNGGERVRAVADEEEAVTETAEADDAIATRGE
ncbi:efflux RND transporter periplasmic adaptor subunit [Phycisphaerales bacterium AB-hyl4]|uniref:Efflux RND transporter periplasmic adaptor subunit n=1 Tax=Natronomicrosphaera hydrolytica TaxID=3242702 RepID=A0ABV4U437_9BACT